MATKFITISVDIMRDENLNQSQKFLLAEIEQLTTLDKGCIASNKHFSDLIGITKENVSRNINELQKKGYIDIEIVDGSRNHTRIITLTKIVSPHYQNSKPPLLKQQETKENKTINKTISKVLPYQIIDEYKTQVSNLLEKINEKWTMQELRTKKHDLNKIIIGIKNYGLERKGTDNIHKLDTFIGSRIYLDYQEEKKKESGLEGWK